MTDIQRCLDLAAVLGISVTISKPACKTAKSTTARRITIRRGLIPGEAADAVAENTRRTTSPNTVRLRSRLRRRLR